MNARRIAWSIVGLLSLSAAACAAPEGAPLEIERLTQQITSEDAKVAEEARHSLEAKGADVVPVLFEKLLVADWTLRPRLLEVLSANGRDFAKQKLKNGSETEKIYAALVYELSVACAGDEHDYDSPEFKSMVEALLRALKSEDKSLRAAAGAALVYDVYEDSTVFFDHLHEIVPALISSFDTDLIIDRCNRGGPVQVVLIVIGNNLTAFVGDRLINVEKEVFTRPAEAKVDDPRDPQAYMRKVLSDNRAKVAELRTYWETWWKEHSKLTAVEIGVLMIERSLRILAGDPLSRDDWNTMTADWCLVKWAGGLELNWNDWWGKNKATYKGPIKRRK